MNYSQPLMGRNDGQRVGSQGTAYYGFDKQQHARILQEVEGHGRDLQGFLGDAECPATETLTDDIIAHAPVMQQVLTHARLFAETHATILLTGESGTGKEVVAKYIHRCSERADQVYVRVNCAALSETLIESELFGHVRGAFTGADKDHEGRFELAGAGTLLLDEISEVPLRTQAKLLRVLEEGEFQRVGSNATLPMRARIIATSNRDLTYYVQSGEFREDLYYRLNVLRLELPPLRGRREDIPYLARHFITQFGSENSHGVHTIADEAVARLCQAEWGGNIRQLRNVIHRACILASDGCIQPQDLVDIGAPAAADDTSIDITQMRLEEIERHAILANLRRFNGNKTATAKQLGVTSRTLTNKMKRYRELGLQ